MTGPSGEATVASTLMLRVVSSDMADRAGVEFRIRDRTTIGREASCDIVLSEPTVSRRHASVEPAPGGLHVADLGSGNGVWIGSTRIDQKVLTAGDSFQIGSTVFECVPVKPQPSAAVVALADATTLLMPPQAAEPPDRVGTEGGASC